MPRPIACSVPDDPAAQLAHDFRAQSDLVVAALDALDAMVRPLATLASLLAGPLPIAFDEPLNHLTRLAHGAGVEGGSLLVADPDLRDQPILLHAVARQPSGAIDVRSSELDRDVLVLTGPASAGGPHVLDRLAAALRALDTGDGSMAAARAALADLETRIATCVSRLSLVKARLDLQESFLASVLDADTSSPCVRLDSHLNQSGARDLAIAARRMLSTRSLTIARGNRATLAALFEPHVAAR